MSAQFQNGAAENGIKVVVQNVCTMMIYIALHWPGFAEHTLWLMALSHVAYLWNLTPKQESEMSPIALWTCTMPAEEALKNLHPRGCPVYVLEPRLKDGKKIPKCEPWAK